ncbi:uncharacterized protein LOC117176057 [Belonocnema kinseyi]|uniref:uncharacterized protein LOC117176057 n=1 Tax=Belonocnema kinseyi TaxID=2817044 RepID=UPI00143D0056|nr:uncharacterized protein LOC117176057 [Belonocnema kinseyi]
MASTEQKVSSNTILGIVWQTVGPFGWYFVGLAIVLFYFKQKYHSWISKKMEYASKRDEDLDIQNFERLSAVRQRMQEKYQRDLELALEKEEEIKERKRQELLNNQESGNRLGGGKTGGSSKSRLLKGEYNPLMGGSSSRGYRPQKRSCCGKGGCG